MRELKKAIVISCTMLQDDAMLHRRAAERTAKEERKKGLHASVGERVGGRALFALEGLASFPAGIHDYARRVHEDKFEGLGSTMTS